MKLSIVFPTRNEEELIEKTLLDTCGYIKKKKYPFEILVILNGIIDNTEEKVKKLSKKFSQIKILKSKAGYGFALKKGLKEAKGDYVVIFNVDFYDFRLVDLVDKDMNGSDIVIGSKLARGSKDRRPFPRHMISLLFNHYLKLFYGFRGTDTHGIKLIRHKVIKKVLPLCETDSGIFDSEFILFCQKNNFRTSDIPVKVFERRTPRFKNRLLSLPYDLIKLHQSLQRKRRKNEN